MATTTTPQATLPQPPLVLDLESPDPKDSVVPVLDLESPDPKDSVVPVPDLSKRAQWLRAAVLGANDGLLSTASLMMGVGAIRRDVKSMIIAGVAGLIAGAFSMAIGELVSVYSQYDIEYAQIKRDAAAAGTQDGVAEKREKLPNPWHAASASAVAFAVGALVPLLAAGFVKSYRGRLGAVVGAVSVALVGFGWASAALGKAPARKSTARVVVGGWVAMGITYGLTKSLNAAGL